MYDDLVKRLREADEKSMCCECGLNLHTGATKKGVLFAEAADAIEELQKAVNFHKFNSEFWEGKYNSLADEKWIPVTERLPEFDQKVLAWVKNKDQEGRFNRDGIYTAELKDKMPKPDPEGKRNFWGIPGYDSVWTVWSWSYFTEPDVLFWMPLPQPPKEE